MGKDKDKDKVSYQLKVPKGTKDCNAALACLPCPSNNLLRGREGYGHPRPDL